MKTVAPLALLSLLAVVGCAEDDHTHDAEDFATYDECLDHYTAEGHDDAEAARRCEDLAPEGE